MNVARSAAPPSTTPPFSFFEWMVARRYLGATKSGKGVSLISIIAFVGIAAAVAVLISVMAIMQGFRSKLLDQLLGINAHIYVESEQPIADYASLATALLKTPGVTDAIPIIQAPAFASAQGETGLIVRAIRKSDLENIKYVSGEEHLIAGALDGFGDGKNGGNKIVIGSGVASTLGVRIGDPVTLISGRGEDTPFGPTLQKKTYEIGAIFHVGNSEFDSIIAFMPLDQGAVFFRGQGGLHRLELKVSEPDNVKAVAATIRAEFPSMLVWDWQMQSQSYFNALQIERFAMRLVLFLILIVAGLNIATGLIMLVKDKTGDIAVLRTMGATQGAIMRIFFIAGSLIGVLGVIGGLFLGVAFVFNIDAIENGLSALVGFDLFPAEVYYLDGVPAELQWKETAIVVVGTLLMSFIVTIYPAWRAARLDPVEALRYE